MEEWSDDDGGAALLSEPAVCAVRNGAVWFAKAFQLFEQRWVGWSVLCTVMWLLQWGIWAAAQVKPALLLAVPFVMLMFAAGVMSAASAQEFDEEPPSIGHLFTVFNTDNYINALLLYILMLISGSGIFYYLNIVFLGGNWLQLQMAAAFFAVCLSFLFFTPALVFLQGEGVMTAVLLSLKTAWRNIFPMLLMLGLQWAMMVFAGYGLLPFLTQITNTVYMGMVLLAVLTLGQLFMMLGCYAAYRDIWFED